MLINCPKCKSPVGGDAINIQENIAQCPECKNVFRISDAMDQYFDNEHKTRILMPDGLEVVPGLQLDIKLIWRKLSRIKMYFLLGGIFTLVAVMCIILLSSEVGLALISLFMSLFLFVGLYFLFKAISNTVNTTYISASSFNLQVAHKPINFLGWRDRTYPKDEVVQLFVERFEESRTNDRPDYAHNLMVVLKNGKEEKIIGGIKKAEVAFYLEHQIEKRLGLTDRPMPGEYIPGKGSNEMLIKTIRDLEKMPRFLRDIVKKRLEQ